jgi:DNA-binding transcriptional LysR family regulator
MLGISSSAVGKAIARLEEQLGTQLFHRTTRTVSLTETGALYLRRAKHVLEELDDAERELGDATAEPRGRLKVSLPLSGSALTRPLATFMASHPQVSLDLDYSDRLVNVVDEGFDAVIRTGEPSDNRLMHRKLGRFGWQLVASPIYLAIAGTPRNAASLVEHTCLRQRVPTGRLLPWTLRDGDEVAIPNSLTATIIDALLDLALEGAGIGAFPCFVVDQHIATGRLQYVLDGALQHSGVFNILWPASRFQAPKTRAFVDHMQSWARSALA